MTWNVSEVEKMLGEIAEREYQQFCGKCPTVSYQALATLAGFEGSDLTMPQRIEKIVADGWTHMEHHAGLVRPCAECEPFQKLKKFAWTKDIDPLVATMWLNENAVYTDEHGEKHPTAFAIEGLRVLLDKRPIAL